MTSIEEIQTDTGNTDDHNKWNTLQTTGESAETAMPESNLEVVTETPKSRIGNALRKLASKADRGAMQFETTKENTEQRAREVMSSVGSASRKAVEVSKGVAIGTAEFAVGAGIASANAARQTKESLVNNFNESRDKHRAAAEQRREQREQARRDQQEQKRQAIEQREQQRREEAEKRRQQALARKQARREKWNKIKSQTLGYKESAIGAVKIGAEKTSTYANEKRENVEKSIKLRRSAGRAAIDAYRLTMEANKVR